MRKPAQAGYADAVIVTFPAMKAAAWRKKALRPGPVFFLLSLFADSSNAFARNLQTRPVGLRQFEIFRLRHWLNLFAKILNVVSKTSPALRASLETIPKFDKPVKHVGNTLPGWLTLDRHLNSKELLVKNNCLRLFPESWPCGGAGVVCLTALARFRPIAESTPQANKPHTTRHVRKPSQADYALVVPMPSLSRLPAVFDKN
ncbi:hypothetical protein HNR65_001999 [Desulfosalsimonas propionicica]|uniref:Uncharacterized protein n=1 Tax=Desulfosalsimonas propionicica TaxID=332175 RepID=A0A7W0HKW4_9BACT|nr:hypothetical protein [Desulfosalsimonas propionicica]MBA2881672.1 hypothetical protein [Desulfosalsimonas propionicica]